MENALHRTKIPKYHRIKIKTTLRLAKSNLDISIEVILYLIFTYYRTLTMAL
jgi:hypothetical protein